MLEYQQLQGCNVKELRVCPRCKSTGAVMVRTSPGKMVSVTLHVCPRCKGVGVVLGRDS
jgi:DnaJ-class molecular chaperone